MKKESGKTASETEVSGTDGETEAKRSEATRPSLRAKRSHGKAGTQSQEKAMFNLS